MSVGIEPARCMWLELESYLSERIQKISIGDAVSKDIKMTLAVPQGSHLVYQQNIGDFRLRPCTLLYAVTWSSFFLSVDSRTDRMTDWRDRNSSLLNVGKCKTIKFAKSRYLVKFSYMLGGTMLDRVSSINDFGVIMDEKMTFSEHLDVMNCDARIYQETFVGI
jgi:hypothetical protein